MLSEVKLAFKKRYISYSIYIMYNIYDLVYIICIFNLCPAVIVIF